VTDGPYKLPEGWRWVRLGEVCRINPRRPRLQLEATEPTAFVPMAAVDDERGEIVSSEVRPFEQVRQGYTYFEEGDVLFAKITPCMENGKSAIAKNLLNGFGFGSTEFHVLRPSDSVFSEWIWLFVRRKDFRKAAKAAFRGGVGQQRVPAEFLKEALIPLPPLSEQRRIVAKVEALMARVREARRLRAEARKDAERLIQAALAEVFPRPGQDLPIGWRWVKLGEVATNERHSIDPRRFADEEFLLYSIPAYDKGMTPERVYGKEVGSNKLLVKAGQCLFSKLNPRIPRIWVVETSDSRRQIASTEFMVLTPSTKSIDLSYLATALASEVFLDQVRTDVTGATGSRQRLKPDRVLGALIPLPPLEEQRRIVAYLDKIQRQVTALKHVQAETEAELRRLEQAILDKAFRGEL